MKGIPSGVFAISFDHLSILPMKLILISSESLEIFGNLFLTTVSFKFNIRGDVAFIPGNDVEFVVVAVVVLLFKLKVDKVATTGAIAT